MHQELLHQITYNVTLLVTAAYMTATLFQIASEHTRVYFGNTNPF